MAGLPQDQAALNALIQAAVDAAVAQAQVVADAAAAAAAAAHAAALVNANAVAGVGAVAAGGVPAPFAVNPAGGMANVPWDFQTSHGLKVYMAVTTPVDPVFDGTVVRILVAYSCHIPADIQQE